MSNRIDQLTRELLPAILEQYACGLTGIKRGMLHARYWRRRRRSALTVRIAMARRLMAEHGVCWFLAYEHARSEAAAQIEIENILDRVLLQVTPIDPRLLIAPITDPGP